MADYNANLRVSADTKQAERSISQLEQTLKRVENVKLNVGGAVETRLNDIRNEAASLGKSFQRLGGIIKNAALTGGFAAISTTVLDLTEKVGSLGAAIPGIGNRFAAQAGAAAQSLGVVQNLVNNLSEAVAAVGGPGNAAGIAAITTALVAFGPQILRAAVDTEKLGAALGEFANKGAGSFNPIADAVTRLNQELETTKTSFADLIAGSTLNELNSQLRDAVEQSGAFHSSTQDAVTAAEQLVAVQREQAREQKAINDLIRKAQGLQPQDVRDTEVSRRVSALKTRELQQKRDLKLQNQINAELAEYERLAEQVAAQTKQWANNLDRIARSSRSGVLGNSSQIRARLEEMRQNRNSAEIARQRSAELLALEVRQRGGNYSLSQVPARGELFPGGNSLTASPQYRGMLNAQAQMRQAAANALVQSERTLLGFQAQTLRTEKDITTSKLQQQAVDQRSIQIARERNKLLLEQYRAEQRNPNFSLTGANPGATLDRASRVADLRRQKAAAKENAAGYENLALGVGFPLLFGGGPGSILGAAGGSFFGSGFGGQILGGAIGQAIDQFAQAAIQLGGALNSPTEAFNLLKERALISTKELEKLGDKLQEAGFAASASALAQQDVNNRLGAEGVRNLQALSVASDDLNRALAALGAQMQAAMAGPLGELIRGAARLAERGVQRGSGESVRSNLSGANQTNFDRDVSRAIEQVVAERFGVRGKNSRGPTSSINYLSTLDPEKLQQILDQYGPLQVGLKIKLTPEQIRQELSTTLSKQLEAIDLGRGITQQVRERSRAQEDLDLQRADMVMQQERAIGDLRRSIEDRIVDIRLSNLQRENELLDVQAQIRLQSLKNSNLGLRSGFSNEQVSGAANAVADYLEAELQIANDAAKIKRDAALEVQRLDIETERFKIQTAIQVSRLNQDTAKQVASIQRNVLRQNQDQDNRRFALEKRIAQLKLESLANDLAVLLRDPTIVDKQIRKAAQQTYDSVIFERDKVGTIQPPGALSFNASGLGGVGVSTAGVETASAQGQKLALDLAAAKTELLDLVEAGNYDTLRQRLIDALNKPLQDAINKSQSLWDELTGGGASMSGEAAERNAGLTDLITQLDQLKAKVPAGRADIRGLIEELAGQAPTLVKTNATLEVTTELLGNLQEKYRGLTDELAALSMPYGELTNSQQARNELLRQGIDLESAYASEVLKQAAAVDALQEQVRLATQLQTVWQGVGTAMGEAMTTGVASVIDGTKTAQEVFATFLQSVADTLMAAAQQIIVQYISMGIARMFAFGGTPGGSSLPTQGMQWDQSLLDFVPLPGRALGGPVTGGSPYMVGEKGPEIFVPGKSGTIIPNNKIGDSSSTSVVVNVDASGSRVQGDDPKASQLGGVLAAAVQAEIIKQKRPGGLLY